MLVRLENIDVRNIPDGDKGKLSVLGSAVSRLVEELDQTGLNLLLISLESLLSFHTGSNNLVH
ncbi:hypothetical protein YC2023_063798 [Brassica napus]